MDSQVLGLKRKAQPLISLDQIDDFEKYLRLIFGNRRKQLGGILRKDWGTEKTQYAMAEAQLSMEIRAEALTLNQVLKLYEVSNRFPA